MSLNETITRAENNGSFSSIAQSVGLTLFFLLLMIVAGVIVYKYHSKIRSILQSGQRRNQKKGHNSETTEADSHQYTTMIREKSAGSTPIYENLTTRTTGYNRPAEKHSRPPAEPEEDLYLQCDLPDDAIYSNDPKCNLANSQEEDVYIIPDS